MSVLLLLVFCWRDGVMEPLDNLWLPRLTTTAHILPRAPPCKSSFHSQNSCSLKSAYSAVLGYQEDLKKRHRGIANLREREKQFADAVSGIWATVGLARNLGCRLARHIGVAVGYIAIALGRNETNESGNATRRKSRSRDSTLDNLIGSLVMMNFGL